MKKKGNIRDDTKMEPKMKKRESEGLVRSGMGVCAGAAHRCVAEIAIISWVDTYPTKIF